MATATAPKIKVIRAKGGDDPAHRFYLAALGAYVTLWEERDQIRKTLIERGEKEHQRLVQRSSGWRKQVLEAIAS